jgi:hypothetical protein
MSFRGGTLSVVSAAAARKPALEVQNGQKQYGEQDAD